MKTNWPTKKLGDVCEKITDGSHNPPKGVEVGFPMLSSRNIFNHGINFEGARFLTEEDFASENKRTDVEPGDVLLTIVGTIGRVIVIPKGLPKFTLQRSVAVIKTGTEIDEYYLAQYLSSPDVQEYFMSQARGGAQKGFYLKDIKDLDIPLPSLEEQKRIVKVLEEKLGKVKEAIQLRQDAIADTEKILSSKLSEIFTEGKEKYFGIYLDKLATLVRGPFGGSLTKQMFVEVGYAVYEQGNVIGDQVLNFRYFITENKYKEMKRFAVAPGDILMSCSGTIGKFTYVKYDYINGIINQALLKITPNLGQITREYLQYALVDYLKNSTGHIKGGAIKNIVAVKELKKIKVPVPDLKTQEKIVKELDELSEQVVELRLLQEAQLADLQSLERSYLHEAFSGELA